MVDKKNNKQTKPKKLSGKAKPKTLNKLETRNKLIEKVIHDIKSAIRNGHAHLALEMIEAAHAIGIENRLLGNLLSEAIELNNQRRIKDTNIITVFSTQYGQNDIWSFGKELSDSKDSHQQIIDYINESISKSITIDQNTKDREERYAKLYLSLAGSCSKVNPEKTAERIHTIETIKINDQKSSIRNLKNEAKKITGELEKLTKLEKSVQDRAAEFFAKPENNGTSYQATKLLAESKRMTATITEDIKKFRNALGNINQSIENHRDHKQLAKQRVSDIKSLINPTHEAVSSFITIVLQNHKEPPFSSLPPRERKVTHKEIILAKGFMKSVNKNIIIRSF